jgi:aldehyde dehydrogenase (NAD+)
MTVHFSQPPGLLPYVDGVAWEPGVDGYPLTDPSTGAGIGSAARCGAAEVDHAVRSAHAARRVWRDTPSLERGRILTELARLLRANREELAELERQSAGKVLAQALGDVETSAQYFELYAGLAPGLEGSVLGDRSGGTAWTAREPYGVTAHIIPWNFPLHTAARSIAPALAAGNTVVAKPAEQTPQSCVALAALATEAGVPDGVFNVITGYGPEAGQPLAEHPLVRRITFTGSVVTGKAVLRAAAENLTPATVELGGKSPVLIFEDCDLDAAIADAAKAILVHGGQVCSAGSRVLVADALHDAVVDGIRDRFEAVTVGSAHTDVQVGPMVSLEHADKVRSHIERAQSEGARLVTAPAQEPGSPFVRPTLLADVTPDMTLAREEVFGPVLALSRFRSTDEAVAMANDTPFGLAAGIWTRDITTALSVARELEAGTIYVNGYFAGGVELPFGGYKASGFGREKGRIALEEYTQVKSVAVTFAAR